jgi:TP901-1 family phage major tail protein
MAVYNGTAQILKMDGTQLAELTNVTMSMNQDVFETTSKESGGWKEIMPGLRDITYTAEGLADFVAANKDLTDIFNAYKASPPASVQIVWTNSIAGNTSVTQTAYITSCEVSAPMEDVVTYSVEFAGTGTPTFTVIV